MNITDLTNLSVANITDLTNLPTHLSNLTDLTIPSFLINSIWLLMLIYVPVYFVLVVIYNEKYSWELFTRGISIHNSINCIWLIYHYIIPNYKSYYDLNYIGDPDLINGLYMFTAYLLVDGLFYLPQFMYNPSVQILTTILHHFVGGIGMYLIANQGRGLGLASYFALTEISTPLLHISWVLYTNKITNIFTKTIFGLFYLVFGLVRICTIPILLHYIYTNKVLIASETLINYCMVYGGSGTLICLNLWWYKQLTLKLSKLLFPVTNPELTETGELN